MLWLMAMVLTLTAKNYTVTSPNGKLTAHIEVGTVVKYSLEAASQQLVSPSAIALNTSEGTWGEGSHLQRAVKSTEKGTISAFAYKRNQVSDNYNQLKLQFKEGFALIFRLYNEGMAYRFASLKDKQITVFTEQTDVCFARDWMARVPYVYGKGDRETEFHTSFENEYTYERLSKLSADHLFYSPLIVEADGGVRLCIAESDVENYPGQFWTSKGGTAITAVSAPYPSGIKLGGNDNIEQFAAGRENYLVKANARQQMPWRIICYASADEQLLDNDMVYRLASPSRIADTSWIRPGKAAWEWWNNWNLYKVDFRAGINTATYKYFVDFAAKFGVEYVLIDDGWTVRGKNDLLQVIPELDMKEIVNYANSKGVGIILWAGYYPFDKNMEQVCKYYAEMGIKGFKVDFMNGDDARTVNFHYRAAAMAAKYHLLLDFHGTYKPTGLNRTYPNVVNFEGVFGQEQNKWATLKDRNQPLYDVTVPFARMLAGPMDYTQGAMVNGTQETYAMSNSRPMSMGTRTHQLAEYVVFLSPFGMLCDSPTHYEQEAECTRFIASVPTVWDETVALKSEIGEYVAVARRKDGKWYVAALTNWTPRDLTLDITPLKVAGHKADAFYDGVNADRMAEDYKRRQIEIPQDGKVNVHLAPGGGFVMVIE